MLTNLDFPSTKYQLCGLYFLVVCLFSVYIPLHVCYVIQSYPTLCDPVDCSPPGSSLHGILQARILAWIAVPSSRGSSWPRDRTRASRVSCIGRQVLYHQCHLGSSSIPLFSGFWSPTKRLLCFVMFPLLAAINLCSARPDSNSGFADPSLEGVWIFSS